MRLRKVVYRSPRVRACVIGVSASLRPSVVHCDIADKLNMVFLARYDRIRPMWRCV